MQSFHPPRQLVNYKRLLEQTHETGERIGVRLPCINGNHFFQIPTGPGRARYTGT